jgi:hypothetical protein
MDDEISLVANNDYCNATGQVTSRMPTLLAGDEWEIVRGETELPPDVQRRVKVIQQLMAVYGTKHYAKAQQQAAQSLGISVRSLRRLIKSWQEQGTAGLSRQMRSDKGSAMSMINCRVKTFEFDTGILSREAPINPGLFLIASFLPSRNFGCQTLKVGNPSV